MGVPKDKVYEDSLRSNAYILPAYQRAIDDFKRFLLRAALFDDALADSEPLRRLIEKYVTQEVVDKVAAEYERGRWLMVVTTNLDSRRPVVWNLGQVAKAGNARALQLFRDVLLASASIPGRSRLS